MLKLLKRTVAAIILFAAAIWGADYLLLRYRANSDRNAFGQVEVHARYAIHLKNKRIEQSREQLQLEECVHSLFPHYQESPCWYLRRHPDEFLDLDGAPWHFWAQ